MARKMAWRLQRRHLALDTPLEASVRLFWAVAVGAAAGGVSRYYLSLAVHARAGAAFPWGTLLVNVTGSLLLGFLMRRRGFPTAPAVIGLILGPMAETQLRRALSISQGDMTVFVSRPLSATFLGITALLVVVPFAVRHYRKRRQGSEQAA